MSVCTIERIRLKCVVSVCAMNVSTRIHSVIAHDTRQFLRRTAYSLEDLNSRCETNITTSPRMLAPSGSNPLCNKQQSWRSSLRRPEFDFKPLITEAAAYLRVPQVRDYDWRQAFRNHFSSRESAGTHLPPFCKPHNYLQLRNPTPGSPLYDCNFVAI